MNRVIVSAAPIDVAAEMAAHAAHGHGASASFVGRVRGDGGLTELFLEHHPVMTLAELERLAALAKERWSLAQLTLIHRIGAMVPGETIVIVLASSPHRAAALSATEFLIDRLKTDVPLWKRETFDDGCSAWVEARDSDAARAAVWDESEKP